MVRVIAHWSAVDAVSQSPHGVRARRERPDWQGHRAGRSLVHPQWREPQIRDRGLAVANLRRCRRIVEEQDIERRGDRFAGDASTSETSWLPMFWTVMLICTG